MSGYKIRQGFIKEIKAHEKRLLSILNANAKNILEIGFLGGHSAEMFLELNNYVNVTSIDIGAFQSVDCGKKYIDKHFPCRHTLMKGDSLRILPKLTKETNIKFDIILIDGSYEERSVYNDIIYCKKVSNENTQLIINNVLSNKKFIKYWNKGPTDTCNKLINRHVITDVKYIDIDIGKGSVVCKYC